MNITGDVFERENALGAAGKNSGDVPDGDQRRHSETFGSLNRLASDELVGVDFLGHNLAADVKILVGYLDGFFDNVRFHITQADLGGFERQENSVRQFELQRRERRIELGFVLEQMLSASS